MRSTQQSVLLLQACIILLLVCSSFCGRIFFEKCNHKGFTCKKSNQFAGKNDIIFICNTYTTWDIDLYLWQFRAPSNIVNFKVANCTSVRLSLMCSSEGRAIQSFSVSNVTKLTILPIIHGLPQSAPNMIFEDVEEMGTIPSRTFLQIKRYPYSKYGCVGPMKDLESVFFKNVQIDETEREAFHNLTDIKSFTFENVTIKRMEDASVQVFLSKYAAFEVINSNFGTLEYLSFFLRGWNISFISNVVDEIKSVGINATVYDFNFFNNTVHWIHSAGLAVLAQNVQIMDSVFDYLATGAFQGIGPGLPENSLMSFGQLKFIYEFKNNLIESLEVGSLHPDWSAYKNVGSYITVTYNALKCSCAELAWLGTKEGFGRDFSSLNTFHELVLKKENNNFCVDAPCILPVEAVRYMVIKDDRCFHNVTLDYMCSVYYPTTTTTTVPSTTKRPFPRWHNSTLPLYQKSLYSISGSEHLKLNLLVICSQVIFLPFLYPKI